MAQSCNGRGRTCFCPQHKKQPTSYYMRGQRQDYDPTIDTITGGRTCKYGVSYAKKTNMMCLDPLAELY